MLQIFVLDIVPPVCIEVEDAPPMTRLQPVKMTWSVTSAQTQPRLLGAGRDELHSNARL